MILNFVKMNEPVYLCGRAGTGKNVICQDIANELGLEFYFQGSVQQPYELKGFIDANGNYQSTQFFKAFTEGGLFMLDEIDASIPDVLVILNMAIANRYFDFPTGRFYAHEDFRVICAGNTTGYGATSEYSGRFQLDGATLDRFGFIYVDYDPRIELKCAIGNQSIVSFAHDVRRACDDAGIQFILSYRGISRFAKMLNLMDLEDALMSCIFKGMDKSDIQIIARKLDGRNRFAKATQNMMEE